MVKLRRCLFSICGTLALLLTACGGGGSGSGDSTAVPPLADNGGVWVGTWSGAGYTAPLVVQLHQSSGVLSGYATVGDGVGTSGRMVDQPLTGLVDGASIRMGVVGQVEYVGTLTGTTAAGSFTDAVSTVSGTWRIDRLVAPFEDGVNPAYNLTGSWTAMPVSTMGGTPGVGSVNINHPIGSNTFTGSVYQGLNPIQTPILAARVSGSNVWYVVHPTRDVMVVTAGSMADATHGAGVYVTYDVSASTLPVDQGTWAAVPD